MMLPALTLVLGGQRSGKSAYAEQLVEAVGGGLYLATAQAFDDEMKVRIQAHQNRRGGIWETHEEPIAIAGFITSRSAPERPILIDCLTLWLSNLMLAEIDTDKAVAALLAALAVAGGPVVLVSSEVGQGIIPDNALARRFVDCAGRMNRLVAEASDRVVFLTAGLPHLLKDT